MIEDVGTTIREAREQRGWSQEFLAAKVGATQSTIDRIESGQTRRSRILPEIAAALELELPGAPKPANKPAAVGGLVKVMYVLPAELVQRVEDYKNDVGVSSDDEAVRRLIDDALKHRDTFVTITDRLVSKLSALKSLREAAGYVLANHPLVKSITFNSNNVNFILSNDYSIEVYNDGIAVVYDESNNAYKFVRGRVPAWASSLNRDNPYDINLDDDIPI